MQDRADRAVTDSVDATVPPAKRIYQTPTLTTFGEVRLLTGSGGGSGGDGGTKPGMTMSSDLRCKEAVLRIGTHPYGFGLYLFSYKHGFGPAGAEGSRHFGVMAQEVAEIMPAAVSRAENGYLQVDYSMLGIHPVHH